MMDVASEYSLLYWLGRGEGSIDGGLMFKRICLFQLGFLGIIAENTSMFAAIESQTCSLSVDQPPVSQSRV